MGKKILCIDDMPEEIYGDRSLGEWLQEIFTEKYTMLIEKDPDLAYGLIQADQNIDVVLLDIEFDGDPRGSEIATQIKELRQDIKIVVLTSLDDRGKKISLRQRKNVWFYFVKANLAEPAGPSHLFRIVRGLLEDPFNEKWEVDFVPEDMSLTLRHREYNIAEAMTVKNRDQLNTIEACLLQVGECIDIAEIADKTTGYSLAKVVKAVNDRVTELVGYHTWGILNSRNCAQNAVKILLGSKAKSFYEAQPTFREEMAALKRQVTSLEKRIAELETKY